MKKQFIFLALTSTFSFSLNAQNYSWAKSIGDRTEIKANAIQTDASGNVYITGYFKQTVDFDPGPGKAILTAKSEVPVEVFLSDETDIFLAKYDANGNYVWAINVGGGENDHGKFLRLDPAGNIYVTGFFSGTADFDPGTNTANLTSSGDRDIFIAKYDNGGNYLWAKNVGGGGGDKEQSQYFQTETGLYIQIDLLGNVYITGSFYKEDKSSIFLSKYDPNGKELWVKNFEGTGSARGTCIQLDASGNIYLAGGFSRSADFDPSGNAANITAVGGWDIFLLNITVTVNIYGLKALVEKTGII